MNVPVLVDFSALVRPVQDAGPGAGKSWREYAAVSTGQDPTHRAATCRPCSASAASHLRAADERPACGWLHRRALPEGKVCAEFLDKPRPAPEGLAEEGRNKPRTLAAGDTDAALKNSSTTAGHRPGNDDARFDYVGLLLQLGRDDDAKVALPRSSP